MEALPQHRFRWWEKGLLYLLAASFLGLIGTQVWGFVAGIVREARAERAIAWQMAAPRGDGFTADFPGAPEVTTAANRTTYKVEQALFTAVVSVTETGGNAETRVNEVYHRIRESESWVLLEKQVTVDGVRGRELHARREGGAVTIHRVFAHGGRLYEVRFQHRTAGMDAVHKRFLDSLRLN